MREVEVTMTQKRRSRRFGIFGGFDLNSFLKFYNAHIHITRTIDEAIASSNPKWRERPRDQRYKLIHKLMGVEVPIQWYRGLQ